MTDEGAPSASDATAGTEDVTGDPEPADEPTGRPESGGETDDGDGRTRRASPFSDLVERVRDRRTATDRDGSDDDPFEALDDGTAPTVEGEGEGTAPTVEDEGSLFEAVEVDELPDGDVWGALEADAAPASASSAGVGGAESVVRDDPSADRPDHVVPKSSYCQRCEHFAAPPEVACTHEGTDIVEVVDAEHFRVRSCPVVRDAPVGESPDG